MARPHPKALSLVPFLFWGFFAGLDTPLRHGVFEDISLLAAVVYALVTLLPADESSPA